MVDPAAATSVWTTLISNLPAIITSIGTVLAVLVTTKKLHDGQEKAAAKAIITAAEVKTALSEEASKVREAVVVQSEKSDHKLDVIHTYVNNTLGTSLRLTASSLRRVASLTKDPDDVKIAEAATKAADAHDKAQAAVVAKLKPV